MILDLDTGEILCYNRYMRHVREASRASSRPFMVPCTPTTTKKLMQLREAYGVSWHTLQMHITVEDMLKMGLTLGEMKVLASLVAGVVYNSYSTTSVKDIVKEYKMDRKTVYTAMRNLEQRKLLTRVSSEITEVSPRAGWVGDSSIKLEAVRADIRKHTEVERGWLWSKEYTEMVIKRYETRNGEET